MLGENLLHFFRIDVLTGRRQDDGLDAALYEHVSVFVHDTEVSGAEPAVRGPGLGIGLRILIIPHGEVGTLSLDFSRDSFRV